MVPAALHPGCNLTPPDTMGAVGPTQFIAAQNCRFVSYDKATGLPDGVLNTTPDAFFASVRSSFTSDPHIRYDRTSQRWYIVMIDIAFPNNRILLAVSDSATIAPATIWTLFFFQSALGTHSNCLADYPTPGIDANAIYVGVNQFCGSSLGTATYAGSDGFVIQKSSVLGAGPIHVTGFFNLASVSQSGPYTPQGVDNPDPNAAEGYFIGVDVDLFGRLALRRVANPGGTTPLVSGNVPINIAATSYPLTQPHLGNTGGASGRLDASDDRLFAASFRDGSIWTAQTVAARSTGGSCTASSPPSLDRDAVFWYELTGVSTGRLVREASRDGMRHLGRQSGLSTATVTITGKWPGPRGDRAIRWPERATTRARRHRADSREIHSVRCRRSTSTGLATAPTTLRTIPRGANGLRWGDYSYVSLDPCDDMTMWTIQEYVHPINNWGTRFAQLLAPPPASPSSASPSTVATGQVQRRRRYHWRVSASAPGSTTRR